MPGITQINGDGCCSRSTAAESTYIQTETYELLKRESRPTIQIIHITPLWAVTATCSQILAESIHCYAPSLNRITAVPTDDHKQSLRF